ncbi:MAG: oxidoreductase [Proteobacteria bacterium]|nr:MAG: oxidoreductase [Pseudomonadota bacterium]
MSQIRVGLIGFGLSGKVFHAGLLKHHSAYVITTVSSSRPNDVHAVLPSARVVTTPEKLIASEDVDLVINCSPNSHHFSLSALALESGKHVVIEKPFVNTSEEGRKLISIAKKSNRVLSVFHNRRWDGDFLTISKLFREGKLGKIKHFESHFDRLRPKVRAERWREQAGDGSGIWFDLGAHLLDQTLQLFGEPDTISADIVLQRDGATTDDFFHVILQYGEMRAILQSSPFTDQTPRFQVFGDKGSFLKFGLDPQEDQLRSGLSPHDVAFGVDPASDVVTERGQYLKFYDELALAITMGKKTPVTAESALRVIELIELGFESSKLKRTLQVPRRT